MVLCIPLGLAQTMMPLYWRPFPLREEESTTTLTAMRRYQLNYMRISGNPTSTHHTYDLCSVQIPESFADCLGGLLSVMGQNLSFKLEALGDNSFKAVHANRTINWTEPNKR